MKKRRKNFDSVGVLVYDKDYHPARFLELSKKGKTIIQIACDFDLTRDILYKWKKDHIEFNRAVIRGRHYALDYFLRLREEAIHDKNMNLQAIEYFLRTSFNTAFPELLLSKTVTEQARVIRQMHIEEEVSSEYAEKCLDLLKKMAELKEKDELATLIGKLEEEKDRRESAKDS